MGSELPHLCHPLAEAWVLGGYGRNGTHALTHVSAHYSTLRPGQGMNFLPCNCEHSPHKDKCRKYKWGTQELLCAMLCKLDYPVRGRIALEFHAVVKGVEGDTQV